jgi:hypothetical protein
MKARLKSRRQNKRPWFNLRQCRSAFRSTSDLMNGVFGGPLKALVSRSPLVQTKFTIEQPNDQYEQEADRVADMVLRMPEPRIQRQVEPVEEEEETLQAKPLAHQVTPVVQRQVEPEEEEEEEPAQAKLEDGAQVQRQEEEPEEEEEESIQTKRVHGQTPQSDPGIAAQIRSLEGKGRPLPRSVRDFFEPRFGYDFSRLRIHTGRQAAKVARAIKARAFTFKSHIAFGAGQYMPDEADGARLLAHELTHLIQQGYAEKGTGCAERQGESVTEDVPSRNSDRTSSVTTPTYSHSSKPMVFRKASGFLDYDTIAKQIYDAVAGWGTDEEAIYAALQELQRDTAAIEKLKTQYLSKYGETLEDALREDLSGPELEYALQLINAGTSGSAQAILGIPANSREWKKATARLREAMEGLGTDEEAIFAVLLPLNRDQKLIDQLMKTYENEYHENLLTRLQNELSGRELDYALYLMVGVFSEETAETFKQFYVKPDPGPKCMKAVYRGLEGLFSEKVSKSIKAQVERDAKRVRERIGKKTNHMDRIMNTVRARGRAGPMTKLRYNKKTKKWNPDPEKTIIGMTHPMVAGWYFFGLSLHAAYHSVILAVDKTDLSNPRIYWMDLRVITAWHIAPQIP